MPKPPAAPDLLLQGQGPGASLLKAGSGVGGGQGVTGWEGESIAARLLRAEAGPGLERPCPTRAPT